jgi:hypothetical protein
VLDRLLLMRDPVLGDELLALLMVLGVLTTSVSDRVTFFGFRGVCRAGIGEPAVGLAVVLGLVADLASGVPSSPLH